MKHCLATRHGFGAAVLAAAAGCSEGYPTAGVDPSRPMSAPERLALVKERLDGNQSDALVLWLPAPCTLAVRWKPPHPPAQYSLDRLQLQVRSEGAPGRFVASLHEGAAGTSELPTLLATQSWVDLTVVRSQLQQLRAGCAPPQTPQAPT